MTDLLDILINFYFSLQICRLWMPNCYAHPTLYSTQQLVIPEIYIKNEYKQTEHTVEVAQMAYAVGPRVEALS